MFGPAAFQDEESAKVVLTVLVAEPTAVAASAYTAEGTLLASWQRAGANALPATFGRGIDWDKVRAKGQALGMPVGDQASLVNVIFAQGVSTRDAATEVSGRGVGLSALKEACEIHDAKLELKSQPGRGTLLRVILKTRAANSVSDNQARGSRAG